MPRRSTSRFALSALVLVAVNVRAPGASADTPIPESQEERVSEPERFELRLGGNWDQGKYGTAHNTRTQYFPFTLKYRGRHFDFSASASYDRVESPNRVVLIEGTPNQITPVRRRVANRTTVASGVGDTRLKGRWYLVEDGGRH